MDLKAIHKRVIGLDVHQAKITACAVIEHEDGQIECRLQEFGGFERDRTELVHWAGQVAPERIVMESTGVYWKSPFGALEAAGLPAWVVNAHHVKTVPGRKTDIADAQWLATLARAGLLRPSFVPPALFRELRLVARYRQKFVGMLGSEKNRPGGGDCAAADRTSAGGVVLDRRGQRPARGDARFDSHHTPYDNQSRMQDQMPVTASSRRS